MISIDVRDNYQFRSGVWAQLHGQGVSEGNVNTATIRALNRGVESARTTAGREIRKVYNIRHGAVLRVSSLRLARKGSLYARLIVGGKGRARRIGLIEFAARQTRRMPGTSVKVLVAGGRKMVRGAFIETNASTGYRGVFRRTGKGRYPIENLRSLSIPQAFANKVVIAAVEKAAVEVFGKTFHQQVRFLSGGVYG